MRVGIVHSTPVPQHLQDYLTRIGGVNLFGEPKFRLVWSGSRLDWKGRPRYRKGEQKERYIVEVFREPTWAGYGDRKSWEDSRVTYRSDGLPIDVKGPFPTRGDYEFLDTVESVDANGDRHYLMPTEAYLDTVLHLYNVLVAMPDAAVGAMLDERARIKREADYNYVLERVKLATDPKFRNPMAAISNTAFLTRDAAKIAESVEALAL